MATKNDPTAPTDLAEATLVISILREQLKRTERENELLRHKLDVLCRRLSGKKSEKVDPNQLHLALELVESETGSETEPVEADSGEGPRRERRRPRRKRATGRQELPEELPRHVVVRDVPEGDRVCACGSEKRVIGEEVSEKLEYVPSSFHVVQTRRVKRACPKGHGVSVGPSPVQAVEKSLAAEGLLAHVVVSKYGDHLPLHRQAGILARSGVRLPRSTLCDWVSAVAEAVSPIVELMKEQLRATSYLQTDDTPVVVLKREVGNFKGRLWAYLDPEGRQVVYDATPTHEAKGPEAFLSGFSGISGRTPTPATTLFSAAAGWSRWRAGPARGDVFVRRWRAIRRRR